MTHTEIGIAAVIVSCCVLLPLFLWLLKKRREK